MPTANVAAGYKLQLSYLDKDGKAIDAAQLPKDLQVTFADDKSVFNADGTVKTAANIPSVGGTILVQATVTSASQAVTLHKEFSVKVVAAADYNTVTDAHIIFNTDVTGTVVAVGDTAKLVPTKAVKNDGTALDATKEVSPDTVAWSGQVASVESSNETVLAVNFNGTDVNLVAISEGTATVTVTLNSGTKFTKDITVKNAARTATTATADGISLSSTVTSGTVTVKVVDQYGNPVKGQRVYGHPAKTGAEAVVNTIDSGAMNLTNSKGEVTVTVAAAAGAKTGSDAVKLSTSADATAAGIGSLTVNFAQAGDVASYELRLASGSESTDANLDTYVAADDQLTLEFIGKDAAGVVANIYNQTTVGSVYTVTSSNEAVATAVINSSNGKINVKGLTAGETTVTVKQGTITRATYVVKVANSTPSVGTVALAANAALTVKASGSYTLDDTAIAKLVTVGTYKLAYNASTDVFDVKDGSNVIGTVEVLSSNPLVTVTDGNVVDTDSTFGGTTNASLLFRLKNTSGAIVNTAGLKLTYDGTAPTAPVLTNTTASVINKANQTTYVVSGTAEAGATVALTLADTSAGDEITTTVVAGTDGKFSKTIDTTALEDGENVTISATATDAALNASSAATVTVAKDITAPTIQTVAYAAGKITITFSEAIKDSTATTTASKYALTGTAVDASQTVASVATGTADDNAIELTLSAPLAAAGNVTVTVADANTFVDAKGNGNAANATGADTDVAS